MENYQTRLNNNHGFSPNYNYQNSNDQRSDNEKHDHEKSGDEKHDHEKPDYGKSNNERSGNEKFDSKRSNNEKSAHERSDHAIPGHGNGGKYTTGAYNASQNSLYDKNNEISYKKDHSKEEEKKGFSGKDPKTKDFQISRTIGYNMEYPKGIANNGMSCKLHI